MFVRRFDGSKLTKSSGETQKLCDRKPISEPKPKSSDASRAASSAAPAPTTAASGEVRPAHENAPSVYHGVEFERTNKRTFQRKRAKLAKQQGKQKGGGDNAEKKAAGQGRDLQGKELVQRRTEVLKVQESTAWKATETADQKADRKAAAKLEKQKTRAELRKDKQEAWKQAQEEKANGVVAEVKSVGAETGAGTGGKTAGVAQEAGGEEGERAWTKEEWALWRKKQAQEQEQVQAKAKEDGDVGEEQDDATLAKLAGLEPGTKLTKNQKKNLRKKLQKQAAKEGVAGAGAEGGAEEGEAVPSGKSVVDAETPPAAGAGEEAVAVPVTAKREADHGAETTIQSEQDSGSSRPAAAEDQDGDGQPKKKKRKVDSDADAVPEETAQTSTKGADAPAEEKEVADAADTAELDAILAEDLKQGSLEALRLALHPKKRQILEEVTKKPEDRAKKQDKKVYVDWTKRYCVVDDSAAGPELEEANRASVLSALGELPSVVADDKSIPASETAALPRTSDPTPNTTRQLLDPKILAALRNRGFERLFPIQAASLPFFLQALSPALDPHSPFNCDLCVTAPTGQGKTLCYVLPIVQHIVRTKVSPRISAIVLLPTRDLAKQVHDVVRSFEEPLGITSVCFLGGGGSGEWRGFREETKALKKKPDFVILTPGKLVDHFHAPESELKAHAADIRYFVADEADRLLNSTSHSKWLEAVAQIDRAKAEARNSVAVRNYSAEGTSAGSSSASSGEQLKTERDENRTDGDQSFLHDFFSPDSEFQRGVALSKIGVRQQNSSTGLFPVRSLFWEDCSAVLGSARTLEETRLRSKIWPFNAPAHYAAARVDPLRKILLSATMTKNPKKLAVMGLLRPFFFLSSESGAFTAPEQLKQSSVLTQAKPRALVAYLLELASQNKPFPRIIVFCSAVDETHKLTRFLQLFFLILAERFSPGWLESCEDENAGPPRKKAKKMKMSKLGVAKDGSKSSEGAIDPAFAQVGAVREFSSLLTQPERDSLLKRFRKGKVRVLVCSDVMARGMDIKSSSDNTADNTVDAVVNFDVPATLKTYIHRCGRTARAGREGEALTLVKLHELSKFKKLLKDSQFGFKAVKYRKVPEADFFAVAKGDRRRRRKDEAEHEGEEVDEEIDEAEEVENHDLGVGAVHDDEADAAEEEGAKSDEEGAKAAGETEGSLGLLPSPAEEEKVEDKVRDNAAYRRTYVAAHRSLESMLDLERRDELGTSVALEDFFRENRAYYKQFQADLVGGSSAGAGKRG